jgi:hypothetical protein
MAAAPLKLTQNGTAATSSTIQEQLGPAKDITKRGSLFEDSLNELSQLFSKRPSFASSINELSLHISANLENFFDLSGFKPSDADQERLDAILDPGLDAILGVHLANSWQQRMLGTLRGFPTFFSKTLLLCIVPALFGIAVVSVPSWHASLLCTEFADVTATFYLYEQLAEVRSTMSVLAECSKSVMVRGTWIVMCIVILCSQVSYTIVLPSSKKTFLPLGAIYVALGPAHVIAKSAGMFIDYMHYASYLAFIGGISSHIVVIGRLIEDRSFWWKMAIWVVTNGVLTMVIEFMLWPSVPDWTDIDKALFVIIFAPILTEVALTIGRFVSRAIPKRHEAAGWVLNGCTRQRPRTGATQTEQHKIARSNVCLVTCTDMLAIKNVQVRLIIALIESPLVILLASSIQVPNNLYNDERDRFLYYVWARLHPQQTDKEGRFQTRRYTESDIGDPTRIARNRTLRVRLLHVETTVEIICTVVSVRTPSRTHALTHLLDYATE